MTVGRKTLQLNWVPFILFYFCWVYALFLIQILSVFILMQPFGLARFYFFSLVSWQPYGPFDLIHQGFFFPVMGGILFLMLV